MTNFAKLTLEEFLAALGADTPTPGGGTAAASAGAMGAALAEMVARLTLSKEKYAASHDAVRPILEAGQLAREEFVALAGEDSEAYDAVVAARRLPKDNEEQKTARQRAIARMHAPQLLGREELARDLLERCRERLESRRADRDAGREGVSAEAIDRSGRVLGDTIERVAQMETRDRAARARVRSRSRAVR